MTGQTFDAGKITVTETDSFQSDEEQIIVLEIMNEETCLLADDESPCVKQFNKSGKKEKQISIDVNDVCLTENNEMYFTDADNKSIFRLSPAGSVSTVPVFSTDPLEPLGICQTMDRH